MQRLKKTIEVKAPLSNAYNQWTQFEEFPRFMSAIRSVHQEDDTHLRWSARFWGGVDEQWKVEITEQEPDSHISWRSVSGTVNAGTIFFDDIGEGLTRVRLAMIYDPEGFVENLGDALGMVNRGVDNALRGFKGFIEARGEETGAWRGEVREDEPQK